VTWKVILLPPARKHLALVQDRRVRRKLEESILSLASDPALRGKPLLDEMHGYRSLRAAGQKYRIIYRVDAKVVTVIVVTVGRRKVGDRRDVYELAKKLIRLGLADPPARYRPAKRKSKKEKLAANGRE
jgi:mRNA interferase RelE/StbE